jgi:hypothetical protein
MVSFLTLTPILFLQETSKNNKHTIVPHAPRRHHPPSPTWQVKCLHIYLQEISAYGP